MKTLAILAFFIVSVSQAAIAQSDTSYSLLNVEVSKFFTTTVTQKQQTKNVTIAGLKAQDIREAPGNILVIDRQEILASGARDIMEVLAMVPGFNFGRDVDDVIGLGIRGQWAHEGKFLILYNGLPLNELDFGTFAFSQRINLSNIGKIEIIIGAGSVVYGGTAALGVINLITFKPGENDGSTLAATNSYTKEGMARLQIGLTGNHYLGNETFVSYDLGMTEGNKTNSLFKDSNGKLIAYADSTDLSSSEIYVRIQRKNLGLQFYTNDYDFNVIDGGYSVRMRNSMAELSHSKKLSSKHSFYARVLYQFQQPWFYENATELLRNAANTSAKKIAVSSQLTSSWTRRLSSTVGLQAYVLNSQYELAAGMGDQNASTKMLGAAAFGDLSYNCKIGLFNAAIRTEVNSMLPPQLAPRIAYSKLLGAFHFKASHAYAFRQPTILNIQLGPEDSVLKAEQIRYSEFQLGVELNRELSLQANFFSNEVKHPIVYIEDSLTLDSYVNRNRTGSKGIEFRLVAQTKKMNLNLGYCFYRSRCSAEDFQEVMCSSGNFLAFPNHRVTYLMRYRISNNSAINTHGSIQSVNTSFESEAASDAQLKEVEYPTLFLAGVDFDFKFSKLQDFSFRCGVENILDSKQYIASPYSNGISALRMNGREYKIQLTYQITK